MAALARTNLRSLYLYLVCLVTLIMSIFAAVSLARNVVELAYQEPSPYYEAPYPAAEPGGTEKAPRPTAEERERQEQQARDYQRREAILGLVGSGTMLLIAGPAYLYHWRRVRDEPSPAETPAVPA